MPILRRLGLDTYLRRGTAASRQRQIEFSRKQLRARLAVTSDTTKRRDIIYYLQRARDPETGEGYVSGPLLQKMTYLRACLDESMRLCPPIPMLLPREVLPGGLHVNQHFFPAGTIVSVPMYALHHSTEHFDRPFAYDPSRWLLRGSAAAREGEGVSADVLTRQKRVFVPFSLGPQACIGRNVALLVVEVSITRALWLYDVRIVPGMEHPGVSREGEYRIKDNFIVRKEGPVLQFRRRI